MSDEKKSTIIVLSYFWIYIDFYHKKQAGGTEVFEYVKRKIFYNHTPFNGKEIKNNYF